MMPAMRAATGEGQLLLREALLADGRRADVSCEGGRIAAIADPGEGTAPSESVDLEGALLLPSLVEGHVHLDKTLLGAGWVPHRGGRTVPERIETEKEIRRQVETPLPVRARRLVEQAVAFGTGRMRCHVDVDTEVGLGGLEALLAVREEVSGLLDIQLVAFPQSGVLSAPGVAALLDAALEAGADVVGGLDPAGIDGDVDGQLGVVFDLAERHGAPIDIHLHDGGSLGASELRAIASRAAAAGLQSRVAVSHAWALGELADRELGETAEALALGGVAIMTSAPGSRPMPPVARLVREGVEVFAGSDNVRDAWSPLGNGDMLERASLVAYRQGLATDEELELCLSLATERAARALGLGGDYGLREGAAADLVAVPASCVPEAVAAHPPRALVVKRGRIVARDGRLRRSPAARS
jgi:cytosine deaminase